MMFDMRFHKYDLSYMKGIDSNDLFYGGKTSIGKTDISHQINTKHSYKALF